MTPMKTNLMLPQSLAGVSGGLCPTLDASLATLFWDSGVGRSMFERILKDDHSCKAAAETGTGARQANSRGTTKMNEQWSNRPYSRTSVYVVSPARALWEEGSWSDTSSGSTRKSMMNEQDEFTRGT